MCSFFCQRMENDHGDLADIVRAGGGLGGSGSNNPTLDWEFPLDIPTNFLSAGMEDAADDFGDPFSNMRDPLLHELELAGSMFFNSSDSSTGPVKMAAMEENNQVGGGNFQAQSLLVEGLKRPSNIFQRMLQISPNTMTINSSASAAAVSHRGIMATPLDSNEMSKAPSSGGCSVEKGGVQISSPRNPGIKRRKSQAKKVVCIPAPAAANSRTSGEVVPSDLWAWRKYGQKPIKGSPYPRGYYRCSSSKGCPARKQVERSRTDPNILVITYTSEHNHPWPTQRNALAGSTRSQPMKSTSAASKSLASSNSPKPRNFKEEHEETDTTTTQGGLTTGIGSMKTAGNIVKEEISNIDQKPPVEMEECGSNNQGFHRSVVQSDDFFADLGGLEADPLNLIFSQGFTGDKSDEEREKKGGVDPFSLYDWPDN